MERKNYQQLVKWKSALKRKPLLIKGARQVGKTFLLNFFGQNNFKRVHFFDFAADRAIHFAFRDGLIPEEIIKKLEVEKNIDIDLANDLLVFDEIQECPLAISSLKYFCESKTSNFVIASGSFLGISLNESSFPVGKIQTITMYPMTFEEFLIANDQLKLLKLIQEGVRANNISETVHNKAFEFLKYYFITGGLPEVVKLFIDNFSKINSAFNQVRELQRELFNNYLQDISKHSGKINAIKIQAVFENVPIQLAFENKSINRFVFKDVLSSKSNFEQLEEPIEWLIKTGLINRFYVCKQAQHPLKGYTDMNKFKLHLFDIGILGHMLSLRPREIMSYDYGSYKGYFAENFVTQELTATLKEEFYSWQEGTSEIELLAELPWGITPIEVKSGINTKAKSLKVFVEKYSPARSFLFSGNKLNIKQTGQSLLPLYALGCFSADVQKAKE